MSKRTSYLFSKLWERLSAPFLSRHESDRGKPPARTPLPISLPSYPPPSFDPARELEQRDHILLLPHDVGGVEHVGHDFEVVVQSHSTLIQAYDRDPESGQSIGGPHVHVRPVRDQFPSHRQITEGGGEEQGGATVQVQTEGQRPVLRTSPGDCKAI